MSTPLLPGLAANGKPVTLGVMGGGQLGRMFVHAAQAMGYATAVLDPDPASPAVHHQRSARPAINSPISTGWCSM